MSKTIIEINDFKRMRILRVEKCEQDFRIFQNEKLLCIEFNIEKLMKHIIDFECCMEVKYRLYIALAQYQLDLIHSIDVSIVHITF